MKYLRRINENLKEEEVCEKFSPYINWTIIEDLKEMALEYLDEGLMLKIGINKLNLVCSIYFTIYTNFFRKNVKV